MKQDGEKLICGMASAKRGLLYVGAITWMLEHAAEDGQVEFTRRQLAEAWQVSEKTARTIIKNLIEDGFLMVVDSRCGKRGKTVVKVASGQLNGQLNGQLKKVVSVNGISCYDTEKLHSGQLNGQLNGQQTPENDAEKKKYQKENIRNVIINNNNINTKKNSKEKSGLQSVGCGVVNFYPEQETGIAPLKEMTQADKSRMIRDIIDAYPRRISPTITASAITRAISRITETQGITQQQAADYLLERVKLYARAVKLWDKGELRYIANPAAFFNRDQYLESEDLWFRGRIEMIDEVEYDGIGF